VQVDHFGNARWAHGGRSSSSDLPVDGFGGKVADSGLHVPVCLKVVE
jgi:hypothetical protein